MSRHLRPPSSRSRAADERGQTSLLIIGFAVVVALLVGVVVDASAAYLQRQSLDSIADGAALAAADGVQGEQVYTGGLEDGYAGIDPVVARRYVATYLAQTASTTHYPGLRWTSRAEGESIVVHVAAPLDLPLPVPGVSGAVITGDAASVVVVSP